MSLIKDHIENFKSIIPDGVMQEVDLSTISRWRIGGVADCVIRPRNTEELAKLIFYLADKQLPYVVIGLTSNLLFSDEGLRAVCIQIGNKMSDYKIENNRVWAQAGAWVPGFTRNVARAGLSGIEHTVGIPGSLGGLVCMNGGSQRKGIGSHIFKIKAVSPTGEIKFFSQNVCGFEYRTSIFQFNQHVITEIELEFDEVKPYPVIREEMLEILNSRRQKFPQKLPNCGSTFISNPDIYKKYGPPGQVIEELGYKGFKVGGAEVSRIHANFINNTSNATATHILELIKILKEGVKQKTGYDMVSEVQYVNTLGRVMEATSV